MNAQELLEIIKNQEVNFAIVNESGEVYCNRDTGNIMDIYGFDDDKEGHFYGVYGDVVDGVQVDSRNYSDEYIQKAIELMLTLGKPVKRSELPKDVDFKRTYYFGDYIEKMKLNRKFGL